MNYLFFLKSNNEYQPSWQISLILAIARHFMSWLVQVYTLTIFLHMLTHIIVMFVLTLCTFSSLFAPLLARLIYIGIRDGAHTLFGVSAPFDTIYIELYHELWFMFCYIYFPFSIMLWYDMFLCGVNNHLFDLTWLDLTKQITSEACINAGDK